MVIASLDSYLLDVRAALRRALCLHNFPSMLVERHNKPEIEVHSSAELVLPPVLIERSPQETALIEQSVNSTRVSFRFKAVDSLEAYLIRTFLRFTMHRADQLDIVRRVAVPGYHISFLITNFHLQRFRREGLLDFICRFVEDLYSEISSMKLGLRSRARSVAAQYWKLLEQQQGQQMAGTAGAAGHPAAAAATAVAAEAGAAAALTVVAAEAVEAAERKQS